MGFGWTAAVYLLIFGYYVLRFRIRGFKQSLFIACLAIVPVPLAAAVAWTGQPVGVGLLPAVALFGTVFLLQLLNELRRGSFQKGQGDDVGSR